jgi:hypothetical protein
LEIWEEIGESNGEKDCPSLPVRSRTLDFNTSSNRSLSLSDELAEVDESMSSLESLVGGGDLLLFFLVFLFCPLGVRPRLVVVIMFELLFSSALESESDSESMFTEFGSRFDELTDTVSFVMFLSLVCLVLS